MSPPADGHRALTVGLVAMVTLVAFETLAVITILPEISDDLGGIAWYGWVSTAFFLGTMVRIVFAGEQADRHGVQDGYVVGLVLFAVGLVVGGLAPSMPVLVVGRFVQGLGAGVVPAIGYVAIGRVYGVERRADVRRAVDGVGRSRCDRSGLAERISSWVGWRWVFLGLLPFVAVAGLLIVPEMMRLTALRSSAPAGQAFPASPTRRGGASRCGAALVVAGFCITLARPSGARRRCAPRDRAIAPVDTTGTLRSLAGLPAVVLSAAC